MAALVIRKHQRFATVRDVRLRGEGGDARKALLVELSLEGCRLGKVEGENFVIGEYVTVYVDDFDPIEGLVRWQGNATYGLRLLRPFHVAELEELLHACRPQMQSSELMHASMR